MANADIRERPAYPLAEAARYVKVPSATLRSWVLGRDYRTAAGTRYSPALLPPASLQPLALSFNNLVEAHVLRSLRTEHGVSLEAVRQALDYAEAELRIKRLLLSKKLRTHAGELFLERYGELLNLSLSGQLAIREFFEEHLERVVWDESRFPVRLYPFVTAAASAERPIAIDPGIAFGRPIVLRSGISTRAIAERIDAGETLSDLAADYEMEEAEIRKAVLYEKAA